MTQASESAVRTENKKTAPEDGGAPGIAEKGK